jgi:DNA-binding IclR family transcriptional regulator
VLPILRSAVGRNLAAHMPRSIIRPLIAQELSQFMVSSEADTIEDPHTLLTAEKMFEKVRTEGISRVRGGLISDYTAMSVPILDYSGATYGALTIMGRYNTFDDSLDGEAARKLKAACATISSACGYSPQPALEQA